MPARQGAPELPVSKEGSGLMVGGLMKGGEGQEMEDSVAEGNSKVKEVGCWLR